MSTTTFYNNQNLVGIASVGIGTTNTPGPLLVSNASGSAGLFVNSQSQVGVGTTSNLVGALTVNGILTSTGQVGFGTSASLTETLTVRGNTSFVGNVTVTTDASSNNYVNAKRVPAGSLDVTQYVTNSVPLTTTTSLINNYLSNAATIRSNTSTGTITQALRLPGTSNSGVNFGTSHSVNLSNLATSNLFIEAWVNLSQLGVAQIILSRQNPTTADFGLYLTSGNLLTFYVINTGGTQFTASNASAIVAGTWYHVAASYQRTALTTGTLRVFVNGGVGGTTGSLTTTQPRLTSTANTNIGTDFLATNLYGNVADVRVMTGGIVPTATFTPQSAPFTTAPTYVTGMSTGYTSNLTLALNSQYFPGASTSPYGPCLTLPGTVGSYYSLGSGYNASTSSQGFTIEAWVNYASLANSGTAPQFTLGNMNATAAGANWSFGVLSTGQLSFFYYSGSSQSVTGANSNIITGQWTHICSQCNGTNIYIFVNGILQNVGGTAVSGSVILSTPLTIGQYSGNQGPNFAIAKARIVYGTTGTNGNVYPLTGFTASPNFQSTLPAGATVAWSLDTQYPLPTYPSFFDVPVLPQQTPAYGAEPVVVGGVTSNVLGPYPTTYPQLDSIRFDGTGYIDYGNAASSVMTTNLWANAWTIEGWIYPTSVPCQLFERSNLASGFDFSSNVNASGQVNFYYGASTVGPTLATVPVNTWTHVAVTYDGTRSNIYVSSNTVGTANISTTVTGTQAFVPTYSTHFGYNSVAGNYLNGNLADVRVSNVAQYTGSTYTVPTAPFATDSNTLLLLKSLAGQTGTTLEVQGRGLNAVSLGATRSVQSYPPAPMSSYLLDTTGNTAVTYGQGKYVASASSEQSGEVAWYAFDKSTSTFWRSPTSYGGSAPYVYPGSVRTVDISGNSYAGEWCQIQLPSSIVLSNYVIYGVGGNMPIVWYVLGSRDGTNWNLVDQRNFNSWTGYTTFTVSGSQAFTYYRIVLNTSNGATAAFYEWTLNGTEEALCITSDAKVGVGIANPQRALEVAGDLVVSGTISGGAGMGSFRNRIINGDMRIDQRNAGASFIVTAGATSTYTLDRWFGWPILGSKFSVQQTSVVPIGQTFKNSVLVTSLSGTAALSGYYYGFGQYIEGYNIADLNWGTSYGTPVTVSFWVRSSIAGSYCLQLEGGAGYTPSYIIQYTVSAADTWQQIVSTIPPPPNGYTSNFPSTTAAGLRLWWDLGSGDGTYGGAAGVWVAADKLRVPGTTSLLATYGATMYLTGVQLEKGTVATPFEFRPYATELALCQRYYQKSYNIASVPGTNVSGTGGIAVAAVTTTELPGSRFTLPMRSNPVVVMYNPYSTTTTGVIGVLSSGADTAAATAGTIGEMGFRLINSTGLTTGLGYQYHYTANAEF